MKFNILSIAAIGILATACQPKSEPQKTDSPEQDQTYEGTLHYEEEEHLNNVRQLTFSGENAEAYWSMDNQNVVFQRTAPKEGLNCDQIFLAAIPEPEDSFQFNLVSTGKGRTTCSFFLPDNKTIIYASTHLKHDNCPPEPDRSMGYVWPLYPEFELFLTDSSGKILEQLTDNDYYDAEATAHPTENKIIYTSDKSGDIELYILDLDTREETQITDEPGYDGGAFFSPDGSKIIWRASRPKGNAVKPYFDLLEQHLVRPSDMELFVANADGSNIRQITDLGGANWAPYMHPNGESVLFSSNHHTPSGRVFNIFQINIDGTGLKQITYDNTFDAFPMFSYDGKQILFSSNRNNGGTRETNVFLADWID